MTTYQIHRDDERANCSLQLNDPPDVGGGIPTYNAERCTVDRPNDATMLACGFVNAGLRVFDIRDPYRPREIAYWKPPAVRTAFLPGSGSWAPGVDLTVNKIAGYVRRHKVVPGNEMHRGQWELWVTNRVSSVSSVVRRARPREGFAVPTKASHRRLLNRK